MRVDPYTFLEDKEEGAEAYAFFVPYTLSESSFGNIFPPQKVLVKATSYTRINGSLFPTFIDSIKIHQEKKNGGGYLKKSYSLYGKGGTWIVHDNQESAIEDFYKMLKSRRHSLKEHKKEIQKEIEFISSLLPE